MKSNNKEIFFSIILPIFNREQYLPQCLESILQQSYQNFEIIAIDDGSTDTSLAILQNFSQLDKRLKILTQPNQGVSQARNLGLLSITSWHTSHFICFIDSDDIISLDYLNHFRTIIEMSQADIVKNTHSIKFWHQDTKLSAKSAHIQKYQDITHLSPTNIQIGGTIWSFAIRFHLIQQHKLLFIKDRIMEDETFLFMILPFSSKTVSFFGAPYYYRQHPTSLIATHSLPLDRILNFKDIISWYQTHQILYSFPIPFYMLYDISTKNPNYLIYIQQAKEALEQLKLKETLLQQNAFISYLATHTPEEFKSYHQKSRGAIKYYIRKMLKLLS